MQRNAGPEEGRRNEVHKVLEQGPQRGRERNHKEQHAEVLTKEQRGAC
jgi:hypothetical protein